MIDRPDRGTASTNRFHGGRDDERVHRLWRRVESRLPRPSGETIDRLAGATIAVTNKVVIDQAILNSPEIRELKLIAVAATGTDIIDKAAAAKRGIKVCNVPGYASQSVAQFTMALILHLAIRASDYAAAVKAGDWQMSPVFTLLSFPNIELSGKKLGIIGFGNIGRTVAHMACAFGMDVLIGARPGDSTPAADRVPLAELFRQADFISLHCPLTPETKNLINQKTLALMKPSGYLINTARGALIDEPALIQALRAKRIAGAALDVISQEPPPANHPIVVAAKDLGYLIVTPHTAWSAREARQRLLVEVKANIEAYHRGEPRTLVPQ
jgi:glycerate dehydrogenase